MVWENTKGKPRVSQMEGSEGPAVDSLDVDPEAGAQRKANIDAPSSAGQKVSKSLTPSEADLFLQTGVDLLRKASVGLSWKETSHCGFRPMNLAGYARANQIWADFNQRAGCWTKCSTHGNSLAFPTGGLCDKVLTDRISSLAAFHLQCSAGGVKGTVVSLFRLLPSSGEMCEPLLSEKEFGERFMVVPAMPRTGGAARLASLLQGRTMLLGTDQFPVRHPPQYWRELCRDLQPLLKREAGKAGVPAVQMQHWTAENAACCFTKVIDHLLGLQGHALYK